jgi:hypothetical protein
VKWAIGSTLRLLKRRARFGYFRLVLFIYRIIFASVRNFEERYIVESSRRQQWFYRSNFPVFQQKHFVGLVPKVNDEDLEIAEQVQEYWKKLNDRIVPGQTIWSLKLQDAAGLVACLEGGSAAELAVILKSMFHSSYIQGISHGFRHKAFPSSSMLVPIVTEDRLVSLAEYLAVVPVETCEQGISGLAMRDGIEKLVTRIERALGFSISFPDDLGASGIRVGDRTISKRQIEHIYGACRLRDSVRAFGKFDQPLVIVEIGGGYGGLCLWNHKVLGDALQKYYIVDLPWVNTFQAFFLKKVFGNEAVAFWNDAPAKIAASRIVLCSSQTYRSYFSGLLKPLIYLNQDSLPEMPVETAADYLNWIFSAGNGIFFSYQQENGVAVGGVSQNNVHALIKAQGTGVLLSRALSWTRDGYTEETYSIN